MSGSAILTFSSIPQTYTHLHFRAVFNEGSGTPQVYMKVNGTSGNNYSAYQYGYYGDGTNNVLRSWGGGITSSLIPGPGFWDSLPGSSIPGVWTGTIGDYTNTSTRKTILNVPAQIISSVRYEYFIGVAHLNSNSAVDSITFYTSGSETLSTDSRVSLYGVKSA